METTVILIITTILINAINCDVEPLKIHSNNKLTEFILTYLKDKPITIISTTNISEKFISTLELPKNIITNLKSIEKVLQSHSNYIFFDKNIDSFDISLKMFNASTNWQSTSKFLIILQKIKQEDVALVFKLLWRAKVYNGVVCVDYKTFFTWYPYDKKNNCGTKYDLVKVKAKNPFIGKIPNKLHFCEFRITIAPYRLYFDNSTKTGFIATFLKTFSEKLNLDLNYINKHNYIQHFIQHGNYDILKYDMETYNIEAAYYGSFYDIKISEYQCEYSIHIDRTYFYMILPPRQIIEPNMVLAFSVLLYIPHLATFLILTTIWKVFFKMSVQDSFFALYQLFIVVQTDVKKIKNRKSSFVLIIILWYTYHMSTFHQTKLSAVLTSPQLTGKIKNLEQFIKSDLFFYGEYAVDEMVKPRGEETVEKIRRKRLNTPNLSIDIEKFFKNFEYGLATTSRNLYLVKNLQDLEIMKDDPLTSISTRFILKKNHPLLKKIGLLD